MLSSRTFTHKKRHVWCGNRGAYMYCMMTSSRGGSRTSDVGVPKGRVPLDTAEQRANEEEVVEKTTTQMYRAPEMVDLYMASELTERVDVWVSGALLGCP